MTILPAVPVLLVDDDAGGAYEAYYESALTALGIAYDKWTELTDGTVTSGELAKYLGPNRAVIWETGADYSQTLTTDEQTVLADFLDGGGRLFITGQDLGYYYLVGNYNGSGFLPRLPARRVCPGRQWPLDAAWRGGRRDW